MSVYIVDYENVNAESFNGIDKLLDSDCVIVFYSVNKPTISIKAMQKIQESKAKIRFKEANVKIKDTDKSFHDALDSQLDTYAGYLIGKHQDRNTQYYIVSNDQGFEFVCEFWRNRGFKMNEISAISQGNAEEVIEELNIKTVALVGEEGLGKAVAKIIREHKSKDEIYHSLVKKYGEETAGDIYSKIRPLIAEKN